MAFIERGTPGLRIVDDWSGFGQRTTASGTVLLDNVPVDAGLVVDNWRLSLTPNIQGAVSQLIQPQSTRVLRAAPSTMRLPLYARNPARGSTPMSSAPAMTST